MASKAWEMINAGYEGLAPDNSAHLFRIEIPIKEVGREIDLGDVTLKLNDLADPLGLAGVITNLYIAFDQQGLHIVNYGFSLEPRLEDIMEIGDPPKKFLVLSFSTIGNYGGVNITEYMGINRPKIPPEMTGE